MKRKEVRELLMQMLFQMSIHDDYGIEIKNKFIKEFMADSDQLDYFNKTYEIITHNMKEIDEKIDQCSSNWKIDRISKVELAVLRVAIGEILFIEDIPNSVSANEAVELAKKFGGNDSGKYVNGILGKILRANENKQKKDIH